MKKNKLVLSSLLTCALLLASCDLPKINIFNSSSSDSSSTNVKYSSLENRALTPLAKDAAVYKGGENIRADFNNQYLPALPSTGHSKMLVVPVQFSGTTLTKSEDSIRSSIYRSFFGESEETGWESVSSFYYKSSYGQLDIKGEVTSIMKTSFTLTHAKGLSDSTATEMTNSIMEQVYDSFFANNSYNVADYDSNNDGYIDSIYMIYLSPYSTNAPALWAYTYWYSGDNNRYNPLGTYAWSSYSFMTSGSSYAYQYSTDKPDAHTYIHETGHLLSLDDYYDADPGTSAPAGGVVMMDNNITDHDMFTKYALDWTSPQLISATTDLGSEKSINLRSSTEYGDSIIIANNFNGTSFDEYLMIEFYTPTGLNKQDSTYKLSGNYPSGFKNPGIRIFHIDQRLGQFTSYSRNSWTWNNSYITTVPNFSSQKENQYLGILATNSSARSSSGEDLILLMDAAAKNGVNRFETSKTNYSPVADDTSLFSEGSSFNEVYPNFKFNDESSLPCNIKVSAVSNTSATITFSAK